MADSKSDINGVNEVVDMGLSALKRESDRMTTTGEYHGYIGVANELIKFAENMQDCSIDKKVSGAIGENLHEVAGKALSAGEITLGQKALELNKRSEFLSSGLSCKM